MTNKQDFNRISPVLWELPTSFRQDMRVPVRIFASERLLEATLGDRSVVQAVNASTLPGVVGHVTVMPDVHQGYGFPIGGVAATRLSDGVISPGGIGYDINCGVRMLATSIRHEEIKPHLGDLAAALNAHCPSGVGVKGKLRLSGKQLDAVLRKGSKWTLEQGYATPEDVARTEENGSMRIELIIEPGKEIPELPDFLLNTISSNRRIISRIEQENVPSALELARELKNNEIIEEFSLSPTTLEDVYVKIVGHLEDDESAGVIN